MRIEFWIKWDFLKKILGLGLKSEKFEIGMVTRITFGKFWDSDLILKNIGLFEKF